MNLCFKHVCIDLPRLFYSVLCVTQAMCVAEWTGQKSETETYVGASRYRVSVGCWASSL